MSLDRIRLVPLGGLGEIGMNCLAIEDADGILIVDCGAAFPDDDVGVDVLHPDFSWLLERKDRVRGVFLTHGHEDHVGALPYFLEDFPVPIWGPPHALGVARRRLDEHGFGPSEIDMREARAGQRYEVGPFVVEPVRVAHSIVEASALAITTRIGTILHTGDFNLDPDPPDGEPTDEKRLAEIGDAGVAVMLSDSTNSDVPERPGSERGVGRALEQLISEATGRVVIAMFASNIQRFILIGEIARRAGRKICLFGRSLQAQFGVATGIGRLHWPSDLLISPDQAANVPRERLLVLAGGTQAEPNSALRRLSKGEHPALKLDAGDTVVLSSRAIPGNERIVSGMMNDLYRLGLHVKSRVTDPEVHTSGHAGRSEQLRMIELVRPRCFVPVHGTLHHMRRHEELAKHAGIATTLVVENGTPVVCDGTRVWSDEPVPSGKISVALGGETLHRDTHRQRLELGRSGLAVVSIVVDGRRRLAAPPLITTRGVPVMDEDSAALRSVARDIALAVENYREGRGLELSEFVRRAARRKLEDLSGTRPVVEVQLTELG